MILHWSLCLVSRVWWRTEPQPSLLHWGGLRSTLSASLLSAAPALLLLLSRSWVGNCALLLSFAPDRDPDVGLRGRGVGVECVHLWHLGMDMEGPSLLRVGRNTAHSMDCVWALHLFLIQAPVVTQCGCCSLAGWPDRLPPLPEGLVCGSWGWRTKEPEADGPHVHPQSQDPLGSVLLHLYTHL